MLQNLQVLIFVIYHMLKYIFHPTISYTGLCLWIAVGLETIPGDNAQEAGYTLNKSAVSHNANNRECQECAKQRVAILKRI